jgi:hypothetical protein
MEVDIIITIGIVAVLLFTIAQGSRIIRTGSMHKTLRKAIEQGQPLSSDLIERLDKRAEPGTNDQRIGFVLVAAALALILAGAIQGVPMIFATWPPRASSRCSSAVPCC